MGKQASGNFEVSHFCCLEACDVLTGVQSWRDVAALEGSGVSLAQAEARDRSARTRLHPGRPVYAWRIRRRSAYRLARPVPIQPFFGPWAEARLDACLQDMPAAMARAAVLSLVPVPIRAATKRAAARPAEPQPQKQRRATARRVNPWDNPKTALALSLQAALKSGGGVSSESSSDDDDDDACEQDWSDDDELVPFKTPPLSSTHRRRGVRFRDGD